MRKGENQLVAKRVSTCSIVRPFVSFISLKRYKKHMREHPKKMKNDPEIPIAFRMNLKVIPITKAQNQRTLEHRLTSLLLTSSVMNGQVAPPRPMPNAKR